MPVLSLTGADHGTESTEVLRDVFLNKYLMSWRLAAGTEPKQSSSN